MFGDGNHQEKALEPEGADQASTSEFNEALAKQAHDNPEISDHASPGSSGEQQQFLESRDGDARASLAFESSSHMPSQNDFAWVPWVFNPAMFLGGTEFGNEAGRAEVVDGATLPQWVPVLFPFQLPVFVQLPSPDETGQDVGFYPVPPMVPYLWPMGLPPGTPAMLKFPSTMPAPVTVEGNAPVTGPTPGQQLVDPGRAPPVREEGVPLGPIGLVQPNGVPLLGQAGGGQGPDQRRVIRRFQVGIQLDLLLLLKLAVVVFVFNQDGSKDRLLLLLGLAGVIYLYQTGSLAPIVQWLAVRAQHIMSPPQQPPQIRPDAQPAPAVLARELQGDEMVDPAPADPAAAPVEGEIAALAEGPAVAELRRQPQDTFWGLVKELQMLVVGFLTSLLPGFHPQAD